MAFTTDWEWITIDRRKDPVMVYPYFIFKENWTLVRVRRSNDTYASELGDDTTSALSALNGGVTESVSPPTVRQITSTSTFDSQQLFPTGSLYGGYPLYASDVYSDYCSDVAMNINRRVYIYRDGATNVTTGSALPASGPPYVASLDCHSGVATTSAWAPPSGFSTTTPTVPFTCVSDTQAYNLPHVDWFTQQQTWVARSRNTRMEF